MHQTRPESTTAPASESDFSRRDFIKGGVAAGLVGGVGLGAAYFGYDRSLSRQVRVGVIGTGDEGNVLIGAINPDFVQVVAIADIRPYNIYRAFHGDESSENTLKHRPGLMSKYGWATETEARRNVAVYDDDYRELIADPNVEAVIIALPLHLHKEASIEAMRRGKHVLCEKLMAHDVAQCKDMARVALQTKQLLSIGHQRHYSVLYDQARRAIERGVIGDIHHIRAQWHRGNLPGKDSWQPPLPDEKMADALVKYDGEAAQLLKRLNDVLADDSWDGRRDQRLSSVQKQRRLHLAKLLDRGVKAEKYGYQSPPAPGPDGKPRPPLEELIRWRLWDRTGGGLMVELGSHQLDAASIFIHASAGEHAEGKHGVHPLTVYGVGGRHIFPHDRDADDHVYCGFEFPGPGYENDKNKKIVVTYSSINGNGFGGYGETVMGTKGTLIVDRERDFQVLTTGAATTVSSAKGDGGPTLDTTESGAPMAVQKAASGPVSRGYTEQIEHWAWCIRNPAPEHKPRCGPEVAMADAVIALVANQAIREGRKITFAESWFDLNSNETPDGSKPQEEPVAAPRSTEVV
ncbi:MAG: gfo/Idh/MocA family oxidoreductase [Planctomycetota bacterium]|nr:MAG: gfo/Idh/MocA family oxidoreductase [Planctomycetota bacterium]REJ90982.1 MAG: gfo/Idh/MocA family oxidoreductase [Planctomycetota bacterium]REK25464.1 MAG: gfo/Idh/MocA family oxidoreductase [Planctomycetota bacterium]REK40832.1 MAG: gfo/Idh/MocA family oxidoreductase [Planctomycetota bacterium]